MSLQDIVNVTITTQTAQVTQAGFGTPLILAPAGPLGTDRVRSYSNLSGMVSDGFHPSDSEYRAAAAIFSQNPRVQRVKVGRSSVSAAFGLRLTPTARDNATYELTIGGRRACCSTQSGTPVATITTWLKAAVDWLGLGVTTTAGESDLLIASRLPLPVTVNDPALLKLDTSGPAIESDLDAILAEDDDWYALVSVSRDALAIAAAAAWIEAHERLYLAASPDAQIPTSATTDIASTLKAAGYARTALLYHPDPTAFPEAAWAGSCLPLDPGSETWKFRTLAGIPVVKLTDTQVQSARRKNCNTYTLVGGLNITAEGTVSANEFVDVIRGRDWLKARLQEDVFSLLANAKKIPFTDGGVGRIKAKVLSRLRNAVGVGFLAADPEPTVSAPLVADVPATDRAARHLPGMTFGGTLAGAIHSLDIAGTISV